MKISLVNKMNYLGIPIKILTPEVQVLKTLDIRNKKQNIETENEQNDIFRGKLSSADPDALEQHDQVRKRYNIIS